MSKNKIGFFCQSCGYESPKWLGKCPSCQAWNTFVEEAIVKENKNNAPLFKKTTNQRAAKPQTLQEINLQDHPRYLLRDGELNRVLGGGVVPGSLVLFAGEPGIGKSTLMLQVALQMAPMKVLYISGEESEQQIKLRAERIAYKNNELYVLTETATQNIFAQLGELQPDLVIVDSIQTLYSNHIDSSPGSVSQIRECTAELLRYAKESNTPVFLIGHITKDGTIAGPKILEHMVDAVLQFEGDTHYVYRLVRSNKNRFGSTQELGIYEMMSNGLREVSNPSEILITNRNEQLSGVAIAASIEGARPLLIEIQALVSTAAYGTPQRSATGYDLRRLAMLLAVLEKRCGFKLGIKDVFLNIAGGIKVSDPAIDLAVVVAVLSSNEDMPVNTNYCCAAEVGLSGEIRPVTRIDQRISEAAKLGFENIIISKYNVKGIDITKQNIKIHLVSKIEEVFSLLFA